MFYMLATVNEGGFVCLAHTGPDPTWGDTVHRESMYTPRAGTTFSSRTAAAAARTGHKVLLGVDEDTSRVCEVWVTDGCRPRVELRLKTWAGCYGTWPLRRLK